MYMLVVLWQHHVIWTKETGAVLVGSRNNFFGLSTELIIILKVNWSS